MVNHWSQICIAWRWNWWGRSFKRIRVKNDAKTRTIIIDLSDLDNPKHHFDYFGETKAVDHNGYVKGISFSGQLHCWTQSDWYFKYWSKNITETGFFNTFNDHHDHDHGKVKTLKFSQDPETIQVKRRKWAFNGAWSVYPYFKSENIIVSDINSGLFIVKKQD